MTATADTATGTMRAAVLTGPSTVAVQHRPVPVPARDEVLVRVGSVGICGSDVHYYRHGRIGSMIVDGPLVLGHEAGGRVVDTGDDVDTALLGQRVALEPQRPCRRCHHCKGGRYNLCPEMEFFATPPIDGAFCDYVTVPADFAHPVPDTLSDEAVALLEPLSVGVWACHKGDVGPGSRVFVTGAGPIGAVTVQAARAAGATEIIVSDPVASRRERMLDFGASRVVDSGTFVPDDLDADAFIDCSGATPAVLGGIRAVRGGGAVVLVGLGAEEMLLPVQYLQNKEITLTGTFRYVDTWPAAISLVTSGRIDLDGMVTARYPLERAEDALAGGDDPRGMKAVVTVSEEGA
ncbi:L-iditol 2-dehydrogenase [Saccharopolyspora lacisalsi]|uniref:L-iditol 2-dehydrogenase n=1 Tax=Halosaccharopolyspora lacisalsi TaxID=1000566 RepID=A0A839DP33_9PSEU|nr:NAD(P)-dependent alcohol dehydrogenase [Halosaccharopolyspora lacisalsi]MBA8823742.1 L-iditol 2-dehydrogenase [Halosaccharopolyspora lacisalsi]